MYRNPLFILWSLLLCVIALLHITALELFLYWAYPWFDILMHFLGGVFVGLSALWFFFQSGYVSIMHTVRNIVLVTGGAIVVVGLGWEIFEVVAGIPMEENFIEDTIIDLVMDGLGAFLAGVIYIKKYARLKEVASLEEK